MDYNNVENIIIGITILVVEIMQIILIIYYFFYKK